MEIDLQTPALLFSATSLILLAYTNRFLTIATIIRGLRKTYNEEPQQFIFMQIKNLKLRLDLIRYMQLFGVLSLFLSVLSMLLLYLDYPQSGIVIFGFSILLLLISLGLSAYEIHISVGALKHDLSGMKGVNMQGRKLKKEEE